MCEIMYRISIHITCRSHPYGVAEALAPEDHIGVLALLSRGKELPSVRDLGYRVGPGFGNPWVFHSISMAWRPNYGEN